jgi:hypothetical protein
VVLLQALRALNQAVLCSPAWWPSCCVSALDTQGTPFHHHACKAQHDTTQGQARNSRFSSQVPITAIKIARRTSLLQSQGAADGHAPVPASGGRATARRLRRQACLLHAHLPGILALRYCSMHLAQYRCRHAMEIRAFLILPAGTARVKTPCQLGATASVGADGDC